jgi:microcystin degradation protein MlrC
MNSFLSSISNIILRDLDSLEREIALNPTTDSIWVVKGEVKNSAGNLALHLCGNLQHYIGAVLGQTGYVRDRPKEFSLKGISAKDLVLEIIRTKEAIRFTFPKIDPTFLEKEYPEKVFADPMTTEYFLINLSTHLGYHLGQVNYHRRLV